MGVGQGGCEIPPPVNIFLQFKVYRVSTEPKNGFSGVILFQSPVFYRQRKKGVISELNRHDRFFLFTEFAF